MEWSGAEGGELWRGGRGGVEWEGVGRNGVGWACMKLHSDTEQVLKLRDLLHVQRDLLHVHRSPYLARLLHHHGSALDVDHMARCSGGGSGCRRRDGDGGGDEDGDEDIDWGWGWVIVIGLVSNGPATAASTKPSTESAGSAPKGTVSMPTPVTFSFQVATFNGTRHT